jgi:phosphatidylglycerophosphate synthase
LVPLWVAPNVFTLIGFSLLIACYANMLIYDYTLKEEITSSSFFFTAFCLFSYSTLNAINGKEARRTRIGCPLGQLFDHG